MTPGRDGVAWPELMRLGLSRLGLTPDAFWALTPAELMLMAGPIENSTGFTRAGLDDLQARFPDRPRRDREEVGDHGRA